MRPTDLTLTVRQAALAYAQRMSEAGAPTSFDLAATLIGTGGIGVQIGTAAQAIAQGVSQANDRLASAGWPVVANLQLICISIARPRLTTPSEPWRRTIRSDMTSFHRWSFGLAPCADASDKKARLQEYCLRHAFCGAETCLSWQDMGSTP